MGISDKFRKMFNVDNDYFEEEEEEEEAYEPRQPQESRNYSGRNGAHRTDRRISDPAPQTEPSRYPSSKVVDIHTTAKLQVVLKKPEHFDEATSIADELLEKRTVVLNLEATAKDEAGKLLCFLSGVAYANGGKLKKIANNTYIITPYNVDVMGDLLDELENNGMFFI